MDKTKRRSANLGSDVVALATIYPNTISGKPTMPRFHILIPATMPDENYSYAPPQGVELDENQSRELYAFLGTVLFKKFKEIEEEKNV